jgi:MOSC domain-containing protein YiiM
VIREGDIGAGDRIDVASRPGPGVTSALVSRAILREPHLLATADRALELPAELRAWMRERAEGHAERDALMAESREGDGSHSADAARRTLHR